MQPFTTLPTANIIHRIDYKWVEKFGQGKDSSFHRSVVASGLLTPEELQAASEIFHLGTTKDKRVVYWQIDAEGRVRDGKLMAYDERCHRVKPGEHDTRSSVSWAGYELRQHGLLDKNWEATHCLFGLHQLNSRPDAMVCIVEAEKTAVTSSALRSSRTASGWLRAAWNSSTSISCVRLLADKSSSIPTPIPRARPTRSGTTLPGVPIANWR